MTRRIHPLLCPCRHPPVSETHSVPLDVTAIPVGEVYPAADAKPSAKLPAVERDPEIVVTTPLDVTARIAPLLLSVTYMTALTGSKVSPMGP